MLSAILRALEQLTLFSDLDPDAGPPAAEHVADALWLATQISLVVECAPPERSDPSENKPGKPVEKGETRALETDQVKMTGAREESVPLVAQRAERAPMDVPALRTPTAAALPHELMLIRALRPLRRRVPSKFEFALDEEATAEKAATERRWNPVLRPVDERWLDLAIVIDDGPSMQMWHPTSQAFRLLLERQGFARDVRSWRLDTTTGDRIRLYAFTGGGARRTDEVSDASGQRLIVILSDCVSPGWSSPALVEMVRRWSRRQAVSLIQMLPQRLWGQTALGEKSVIQVHAPRAACPSPLLSAFRRRARIRRGSGGQMSLQPILPITTLEPEFIWVWSRFVATSTGGYGPAVSLQRLIGHQHKAEETLTASETVDRFQAQASPLAFQLACLLAAAPLRLPIIRLVQQSMLPRSGQAHLAEFLLSGLLRREPESSQDIELAVFDFKTGIREKLLDEGMFVNQLDVQRRISAFIAPRFGQALNFDAYLADPNAITSLQGDPDTIPFANVSALVLRRLGGKYREAADRFTRDSRPNKVADEIPKPQAGLMPWAAELTSARQRFLTVLRRYRDSVEPVLHNERDAPLSKINRPRGLRSETMDLPQGWRMWASSFAANSSFSTRPVRSHLSDPALGVRWSLIFLSAQRGIRLGNYFGIVSASESFSANSALVEVKTTRQLRLAKYQGRLKEGDWRVPEWCFLSPEYFDGIAFSNEHLDPSSTSSLSEQEFFLALFQERVLDVLQVVSADNRSAEFLDDGVALPPLRQDENHLFVSYAQSDNLPASGGNRGWVSILIENLRRVLMATLGTPDVRIFMDENLAGDDRFAEVIQRELESSRMLLVVTSPAYQNSAWCRHELEYFVKHVSAHGAASRLAVVEMLPSDRALAHPSLLSLRAMKFWRASSSSAPILAGYPSPAADGDSVYWNRVNELGQWIASSLHFKLSAPPQTDRMTVPQIIVLPTSDIPVNMRQRVIDRLKRTGHGDMHLWLGLQDLPLRRLIEDIPSCEMVVCIVARRYGQVPSDLELNPKGYSVVELGYREAKRHRKLVVTFMQDEDVGLPSDGTDSLGVRIGTFRTRLLLDTPVHRFRNVDELESLFDDLLARTPHNLSTQSNEEESVKLAAGQVLLFVGHTIDRTFRAEPRFPASMESRAAEAIHEAVARECSQGQIEFGISCASDGGDILFLEACTRLKVPIRICLPFPVRRFVAEYLAPLQGDWARRFERLVDSEDTTVLSPDHEAAIRTNPWFRNAEQMFDFAVQGGTERVTLIALWNGRPTESPGGPTAMLARADTLGLRIVELNTREIFADLKSSMDREAIREREQTPVSGGKDERTVRGGREGTLDGFSKEKPEKILPKDYN